MDRITVSEGELIQALQEAFRTKPDGEGYLTTNEISEATGMSREITIQTLRKLKLSGRLESGRVYREDLGGRFNRIPAYRLNGHEKAGS